VGQGSMQSSSSAWAHGDGLGVDFPPPSQPYSENGMASIKPFNGSAGNILEALTLPGQMQLVQGQGSQVPQGMSTLSGVGGGHLLMPPPSLGFWGRGSGSAGYGPQGYLGMQPSMNMMQQSGSLQQDYSMLGHSLTGMVGGLVSWSFFPSKACSAAISHLLPQNNSVATPR
jgi:hypothetical protein